MSDFKLQMQHPVLVIDDEADLRALLEMSLSKMGLQVETAAGVVEAKKKLAAKTYDLVLTDMKMPDGNGLEVVEFVAQNSDTPIAVITAFGNPNQAVQAMKMGAFDYIAKPVTLAQLRTLVKSAINIDVPHKAKKKKEETPAAPVAAEPTPPSTHKATLTRAKTALAKAKAEKLLSENGDTMPENAPKQRLLGNSEAMQNVRTLIAKLAKSDVSVYITGESGTGKEQAARSIHELSNRADNPFIAVNCGAIPENLMESEFFGYKKGSFTGADSDRDGFFQAAHNGTLFLDEVADLPLSMQVKLLRVIQEKAVRKIGEHIEMPVNVRLICATHKNLEREVESGRFRQDLYYRLNIVTLEMPSLRDLDVPDKEFLIEALKKKIAGENPVTIGKDAMEVLKKYSFPGNFRELENILERAIALSGGETISSDDLQLRRSQLIDDEDANGDTTLLHGADSLEDFLDQTERRIIEEALKKAGGNRTNAAKLLGISFYSLKNHMNRLAMG
ncbi:MAG: sigma-54-dependent Fis family transcriptional regulator, partial [Neisseriaceae bacterium]|nr:sigma-54-dependent Fis family transcriptional regulator [Neisseriaceae bacterium]MBR5674922.1 sigma-54-dependent Fis family transcriptional regulator [Neisseriaceae bacterium]